MFGSFKTFKIASLPIVVLGSLYVGVAPAFAEKTAAQIKCEEEGGTWSDKGNGNTFCFKKLPPMQRADPSCPTSSTGATAGIAITEEGGPHQHADKPRPKGVAMAGPGGPKMSASQNGQTLRHAISTKDTGCTSEAESK